MEIENTLSYGIAKFTSDFRLRLESSMNEIGLHGGQVFILISLWQKDGQNQTSLAEKLNLSTPTINKMVKNLTDGNFISCQRCETDSRMVRVYLTDKGREHESFVNEQWSKLEASIFLNLTETEKLIFSQLLEKLKENFVKKTGARRGHKL